MLKKMYNEKVKPESRFLLVLFIVSLVLAILNRNSQMMGGLLDYYIDFGNIIKHNFNQDYSKMHSPTFPMWGYGWLLMFTLNRYVVFFCQFILSTFAILELIFYLKKYENWSALQIGALKYLLLMSFSFLSINFTMSPYSIAISLLVLSILNLMKSSKSSIKQGKFNFVLISAACFGILLNFRSDYIYFSLIVPIILYVAQPVRVSVFLGMIWISVSFLFLVPWMLYTYNTIGKPLLTSTNSGHVFFIGLGNLPNNKWNITTSDSDTVMYNHLKSQFGPGTLSYRYKEDLYLKKKFIEMVKDDPHEYMSKVIYSGFKSVISGIYVPEFYNILGEGSIKGCKEEFIYDLSNRPIKSLFENSKKTLIYCLTYFSILLGILVMLIAHIILPVMLYKSLRDRVLLNLLLTLVVSYQFLINAFAFQMKLYSTYSYIWSLLLIILFFDKFFKAILTYSHSFGCLLRRI